MNPSVFASPSASACIQGALGSNGPDRISLKSYDAANELTQVTTGYLTANQINYAPLTYTANGFVQTVLDGANNLTTVVYDSYDQPYQVQFPMPTAGSDASNSSDCQLYGAHYLFNGDLRAGLLRRGHIGRARSLTRPLSATKFGQPRLQVNQPLLPSREAQGRRWAGGIGQAKGDFL